VVPAVPVAYVAGAVYWAGDHPGARRRTSAPWTAIGIALVVVGLGIHGLADAKTRGLFLAQGLEQRYATVAHVVRDITPEGSVVLAGSRAARSVITAVG
jgi:hypothetical protein